MLPNRIFENYSHLHITNKPSLLPCLPHILHVDLISRPLSPSHCGNTHVDALLNSFLPCSPNDRYSFDSFSQANWHRLYKKKFRSQIASFCLSEGKIQLKVCLYILSISGKIWQNLCHPTNIWSSQIIGSTLSPKECAVLVWNACATERVLKLHLWFFSGDWNQVLCSSVLLIQLGLLGMTNFK